MSAPGSEARTRRIIVTGVAVLGSFVALLVAWSLLAPLDEGVVAPGVVQLETKRKPIQYPSTAVIERVLVREGQAVRAGQLLAQLDDAQARASQQATLAQVLALQATEARLAAEAAGATSVSFDASLTQGEHAATAAGFVQRERRLFEARRQALAADLSVLRQSIVASQEQERALRAQLEGRRTQQGMVGEQIASNRKLAGDGFISRNRLLDDERLLAELNAQVSELQANVERARSNVAELELRVSQRQRDYAREVDTQAADVRRELAVARERLSAADAELRRTRVLSPVDGTVVGLALQSRGAVVPEGGKLMDIVPERENLVIEAHVPPEVIDRVHAGLKADVRFIGFSDLPFLAIEGEVISISGDRLEEPGGNRPPFYLARIQVTPQGLKHLGPRPIQPGMPVEVVVRTGQRTVLAYLAKPLLRRVSAAMTER